MKSVAIIGAGFSGLVMAKVFKQYGFSVSVFEKEPEIGGVWSSSRRYPGLTTQNPKDTYFLSDLKMPKSYPEWPQGSQVQQYLETYVDHCHLRRHVQLQTEVQKVNLTADNKWKIETRHIKDEEARILFFDFLIICNGIFSDPFIPYYKGVEDFKASGGQLLHSSQLNDLSRVANRDILIVGYGKSSCDIANAVSDLAKSTTVVARSIIWKVPKRFFGLLNMKYILLTRLGENLFEYINLRGFSKFLHTSGKPLRNSLLSSVQSVVTKQLKLKQSNLEPINPLDTIARANVSLASDHFFEKVILKKITVKKDNDIQRLEPGKAVLLNGQEIPADVIVCGTGYQQKIPFMSSDLMGKILDDNGDFRLYRNQLPIAIPNLGFNGYNSSFYSQLNAEIGAVWLAEYFTGGFTIPSQETCRALTDKRLAWSRKRTDGKNSKGTSIIPFSLNHIDELLNDIGINVSPFTRFKQWLVPANPVSYASVIKKIVRRFERERKNKLINL